MASQEPTSFRDQSDAAIHQPDTGPDRRIINANTQAAVNRTISALIKSTPDIGPGLEKLVQDYPTISREMAAGLVVSGQINLVPTPLLDELAERDRQQQGVASDNPLYSGFKTGIRKSILGMEDLYNMSPLMALPRYAINRYQGKTDEEAQRKAQTSVLGIQTGMQRLGIETDYGQGLLPSEELVPGDAGYFDMIKQMILDGVFEGSPEEQLLAASQEAMIKTAQETGMNPWAVARASYLSTQISRTISGENYAVPYSPGSAVAINFTTPGTRSYALTSGLTDAAFRLTLEPVDVVFDNVGDALLKSFNPSVTGDFMSFVNKGSETMHELLKGVGVDIAYEPILIRGARDRTGATTKRAKAVTGPELNPDGTVKITMDVEQTGRTWYARLNDMDSGSNTWVDPTDPYAKFYADQGLGPDDVRSRIGREGGLEAESMLTLEHELVHAEVQIAYYDVQVREDGTRFIDTAKLSDDAPDEMKAVAQKIKDQDLGYDRVTKAAEDMERLDEYIDIARKDVDRIKGELKAGVDNDTARRSLERELRQSQKDLKKLEGNVESVANAADEVLEARRALNEEMAAITELEAISRAWNNMLDGSWSGPDLYKKYRRQAGLTNRLRPWVNPKTITEWLQSKVGKRTLGYLARTDDFESLRRIVGYLDDEDIVKVMNTTDEGKIATIIQEQFNAPGQAGLQQPTVGVVRNKLAQGLDGWKAETEFLGGTVAKAQKAMGRSARRARASVGNNILSVTDRKQTLDTINSMLSTIGVDPKIISELQEFAVLVGHTEAGIDEIASRIEALSKKRLKEMDGGGIYTDAEIDKIWDDWRGYDIINRRYWVSNAGKDRRWLYVNNKFQNIDEVEAAGIKGEAFMEAQFASTHRVMPDIRRMRRLHSRQRNAYERGMQWRKRRKAVNSMEGIGHKGGWEPTGFDTTRIMHAGDVSFGLWRDLNLMRMGWAMRVIPEEQLRFGATGYSGMFTNPVDYFISMLNRMDFVVPGDEITLGEIIKMQEGLGTAQLRDPGQPAHMVTKDGWEIAYNTPSTKVQFWRAMSREFITSSNDEILSMVARQGGEKTLEYLRTPAGREIVKRVARDAAQESTLAKIANDADLVKLIDIYEHRLAQITGGEALWLNPVKTPEGLRYWENVYGHRVYKATDTTKFNNVEALKTEIAAEVTRQGGDPVEALKGHSKISRADAESLLNQVRGYNLDELEATGRAAVVVREGNEELRGLVGNKTLDDITIRDDMPLHEIRQIDQQLEEAFTNREVAPPDGWPVPQGDLNPDRPGLWNATTDNIFLALNGVPSRVLNRSPFFQQAFGAKIAEAYFYGDSTLRSAIDEFATANPSFKITLDMGKRKVFKDMGVSKMPKPFDVADRMDPPKSVEFDPKLAYEDAAEQGMYDRVPLGGDEGGYITGQFTEYVERLGIKEEDPSSLNGIWYNYAGHGVYDDAFPGMVFAGGNRVPLEEFQQAMLEPGLEHLYKDTPRKRLRDQHFEDTLEKLFLPENRHLSVSRESLEELGYVPEAGTTNADGWIGLQLLDDQEFIAEVEALRKLRSVETIDITPATEKELGEAAERLGWRHRAETTGYSLNAQRAAGYSGAGGGFTQHGTPVRGPRGGYVGVYAKEHFPTKLQEHFIREGDIEQSYALSKRYPELAAIDGFVDLYNDLRLATRMQEGPGYNRWMYEGVDAVQPYFQLLDFVKNNLPDDLKHGVNPADWRAGYPLHMAFDMEMQRILPGVWSDDAGRELLADAIEEMGLPPRLQDVAATPWRELSTGDKSAIVKHLFLQSAPEIPKVYGVRSLTAGQAMGAIEHRLGRAFSAEEEKAFRTMYAKRAYAPDENVVLQSGIEPIAELPKDMALWFQQQGMMVSTKRQVGDLALAIDRNLDAHQGTLFPYEPLDGTVISTIPDPALSAAGKRDALVGMFSEDMGAVRKMDDLIDAVEHSSAGLPGNVATKLYKNTPEGPEEAMDIALWMGSPQFRSFAHGILDYADYVDIVHNKYKRALDAVTVPKKGPMLPDVAWIDRRDVKMPDSFWEPGGTGHEFIEVQMRMEMFEGQLREGRRWAAGEEYNNYGDIVHIEDFGPETIAVRIETAKQHPLMYFQEEVKHRASQWVRNQVDEYDSLSFDMAIYGILKKSEGGGFNFSQWSPKQKVLDEGKLELDFDGVPQLDRNDAVQRMIPGADAQNYDYMEIGSMNALPGQTQNSADDLEELLKAAKYDSIEETKDIFYDLTNKSNVADAMKFIFPFGDAWYEVLSRWAHIMNPFESGGQSFRNVRRIEQAALASKLSGFISTNEYGEEVFNWPMAPGSLANAFLPDSSNVALQGRVPVSSLMFIDPSARGVGLPGVSPGVQLATQFLAPATESIPVFNQTMQWLTYGAQTEYRPGEIVELGDVAQAFMPTTLNRAVSVFFQEENREMLGNIKFRLFETLGMTGDPMYNLASPDGSRRAWDIADTAGTWLGFLRILDAWTLPGQPQYSAVIDHPGRTEIVRERPDGAMTYDEILEAAADESPEHQAQIVSILRASNEYRLAKELWTGAEADMYMIERYDVLPSMLQSASSGLLERPVTWGGVEHLNDNDWLFEAAPLTLAATVPHDADDTFSSAAWNNLFSDVLKLDGVENQPIRVKRSPSEMRQAVERGAGYDQVRYQNLLYDRALLALRTQYGDSYASNEAYRARKVGLDQKFRTNIENIYTQFPIVESSRQGEVVGARNGIKVSSYVDEIKDIGTVGSPANLAFRDNMPHLADVAEQYAEWFGFMEAFSRRQEQGSASSGYWTASTSDKAEKMRLALARDIESYYGSLDNPDAKKYAKWLNQYLLDPLLKEWEWIDQGFAPEMESYPSIQYSDTLPTGGF